MLSNTFDNPAGQLTDEDDIKGIKKTDKDFHKINKETYEMQLLLDSKGYYSSRLGVNMYLLPNCEYSMAYELYYPNSMNDLRVIGYPCLRKELWDRQGANSASR